MTKQELFIKYSINETNNVWDDSIDNWYSIEVYRAMHNGELPPPNDMSIIWVLDFLDKCHADSSFMVSHKNWGSLYLTAKRMVYILADDILETLNKKQ